MDLILFSGGIKTGSLRKVKLIQNNKIQIVDLYEIIFGLNPSTSFPKSLKMMQLLYLQLARQLPLMVICQVQAFMRLIKMKL